jgi:predicted DNA-binding protein
MNMEVKQTSIRLPYEAWEKLKEITDRKGYTMNMLVITELWKSVGGVDHGNETDDVANA